MDNQGRLPECFEKYVMRAWIHNSYKIHHAKRKVDTEHIHNRLWLSTCDILHWWLVMLDKQTRNRGDRVRHAYRLVHQSLKTLYFGKHYAIKSG